MAGGRRDPRRPLRGADGAALRRTGQELGRRCRGQAERAAAPRPCRARGGGAARSGGIAAGRRARGIEPRRNGPGGSQGTDRLRPAPRCAGRRGRRGPTRLGSRSADLDADPRLPPDHPLHPPRRRRNGGAAAAGGRRDRPERGGGPDRKGPARHLPGPPDDQPRRSRPGRGTGIRRPLRGNRGDRPRLLAGDRARVRRAARRGGAPRDQPRLRASRRGRCRARPGRVRSRARAGRSRPRGIHRGAADPRRGGQPGEPADPVQRPGAEGVRQGHRRGPGDDPLRGPGGGRLHGRRRSRLLRPRAGPAGAGPGGGGADQGLLRRTARGRRQRPAGRLRRPPGGARRRQRPRRGDVRTDLAQGVDRTERRSRLRTRRHLPRPARSGGRGRPVPGGRAGAARRLRLLRVRAGAEAARFRHAAGARDRGADLVRRERAGGAGEPGRRGTSR